LHVDERLLHRDIKPSNILVGKGDKKLLSGEQVHSFKLVYPTK